MREIEFRFVLERKGDGKLDHNFRTLDQLLRDKFVCNDSWRIKHTNEFTGLLDKNGKKIFEGDIVDCGSPFHTRKIVEWKEWGWGLKSIQDHTYFDWVGNFGYQEFEVIGNIYENPELLKEAA